MATYEFGIAPFKILTTFFPVVEFEASYEFGSLPEGELLSMHVQVDNIAVAPVRNSEREFSVSMDISLSWNNCEHPPYTRAKVRHVGIFELESDPSDESARRNLFLSAQSILFSGAREFIKSITLSGPYGEILLPPMVLVKTSDGTERPTIDAPARKKKAREKAQ